MVTEKRHEAWLRFTRDILDLTIGKTHEEMVALLQIARKEYPRIVPIVSAYLRFMEKSESDLPTKGRGIRKRSASSVKQAHLFDLLRERRFFPQNLDLARFAARVVPEMRTERFVKLSRSEIAAKFIDYLESIDPRTRVSLEDSMREALATMLHREPQEVERRSFLSKWERIIKGIEP